MPRLITRALVALVLLPLGAACGPKPRPNVLLLVMDTTRADRCSFLGSERPTTPRLAEFARDAVAFREAWSPSNWTGPAHASLFTGLEPRHHGFDRASHPFLGPEVPVIAERFAAAGYATGCFTNNAVVTGGFGLARGFDKHELTVDLQDTPYRWAATTHERAAQWAEASRAKGRPFFLFVNDMEPHQPYEPPPELAAAFVRGAPGAEEVADARGATFPKSMAYDLGLAEISPSRMALLSDLYDAEIASLDRAIGELLDRFRTAGLLDDTIVVIVSDHGEYFGEHRLMDHAFGLYRAVCRVPLLVRYPGRFDGGRSTDDVVRLEDVPPTLLELCGLDPLDGIDGRSLLRDVGGRVARGSQSVRDWLSERAAAEYPTADVSRLAVGIDSLFDGTFHLLDYSDGHVELYRPRDDPDEAHDVSAEFPGEVARMRELLRNGR